ISPGNERPSPSGEGPVGLRCADRLLATLPPRPSVVPPAAGNEEDELLKADQDRADKGEDGYLGGLDGQVNAAAVRGHDHGGSAAIRLIRDTHDSWSIRGRSLNPQPDHRDRPYSDGPAPRAQSRA